MQKNQSVFKQKLLIVNQYYNEKSRISQLMGNRSVLYFIDIGTFYIDISVLRQEIWFISLLLYDC